MGQQLPRRRHGDCLKLKTLHCLVIQSRGKRQLSCFRQTRDSSNTSRHIVGRRTFGPEGFEDSSFGHSDVVCLRSRSRLMDENGDRLAEMMLQPRLRQHPPAEPPRRTSFISPESNSLLGVCRLASRLCWFFGFFFFFSFFIWQLHFFLN